MSTIALTMIVKNEAGNIGRCLASVAGVVDEIVIVDTGSTDDTPTIAASLGARVEHHPWQNNFSQARNLSLAMAKCDWVLYLDADEELPPETRSQLRSVVEAASADGLAMCVRNLIPADAACGHYESWQLRLFRHGRGFFFQGEVHEQVAYSIRRAGGVIEHTNLILVHYGYLGDAVQGDGRRLTRNLHLLEAAVSSNPRSTFLWTHLGLAQFRTGDHAAAMTSLKRALFDLNGRDLTLEMLHRAFIVLAQIGLARQQFDLALTCATASLELGQSDNYTRLEGLKTAANACLGKAMRLLADQRSAIDVAGSGGNGADCETVAAAMRELDLNWRRAGDFFSKMLAEPDLSAAGRTQALRSLESIARLDPTSSMPGIPEVVLTAPR